MLFSGMQGCEVRSKHSYLAAYLLQEKYNPKSYWKPYLDILPQKYANMPVFFPEATMEWLRNSMSMQKISDRIDSLRREYDNIRRVRLHAACSDVCCVAHLSMLCSMCPSLRASHSRSSFGAGLVSSSALLMLFSCAHLLTLPR